MRVKWTWLVVALLVAAFLIAETDGRQNKKEKKKKKFKKADLDRDYTDDEDDTVKGKGRRRQIESMVNDVVKRNRAKSQRDSMGNGLRRGHTRRDKRGRHTRLEQEYEGVRVFGGGQLVSHVQEGGRVELKNKTTGEPSGRVVELQPREYVTGAFIEDLNENLGQVDAAAMEDNKGQALERVKVRRNKGKGHGAAGGKGRGGAAGGKGKGKGRGSGGKGKGKNRGRRRRNVDEELAEVFPEISEPIIYLNQTSGDAVPSYLVKLLELDDQGENATFAPSYPHTIVDEEGNVLLEWEGLNTYTFDMIRRKRGVVRKGRGPGGNRKTGQHFYGQDGRAHFRVNEGSYGCTLETPNVKTINLYNTENEDRDFAYSFPCYLQENDPINGAYSPLNDAHYYANKVYDMYESWYQKPPLKQTQLTVKVHYGQYYENAYFDGRSMVFGDGGSYFYPLVSLDVMSHEIAHGVTGESSGLVYQGKSGGLNEAFSDMAGKAAERFVRGKDKVGWGVGVDITKGEKPMRCMDKPGCDSRSIGHVRQYRHGIDVHYSSGIFNKVFYRMSKGLPYDVWDAFDIFYVANTNIWTAYTDFVGAAEGILRATEELIAGMHLETNYEYLDIEVVLDALREVGIECGQRREFVWSCREVF